MAVIHYKCSKCHHEWDTTTETSICDWCKASGREIDRSSPLDYNKILKELQKIAQPEREEK